VSFVKTTCFMLNSNQMDLLRYVSEHLDRFKSGGVVGVNSDYDAGGDGGDSDGGRVWIRGWFPVLFELSCIINRSNLDIRTRSLTILFDVVKQYGGGFEDAWWKDLFGVIFRIFDLKLDRPSSQPGSAANSPTSAGQPRPARTPSAADREWMDTTCNHALYAVTDVFGQFFSRLAPILLPEMLAQYKWCLSRQNEQLSRSAVACVENLIVTNRSLLTHSTELAMIEFLGDVVRCTSTNGKSGGSGIHVHLEILNSVNRVVVESDFVDAGDAKEDSNQLLQLLSDESFAGLVELVDNLLLSFDSAKSEHARPFELFSYVIFRRFRGPGVGDAAVVDQTGDDGLPHGPVHPPQAAAQAR